MPVLFLFHWTNVKVHPLMWVDYFLLFQNLDSEVDCASYWICSLLWVVPLTSSIKRSLSVFGIVHKWRLLHFLFFLALAHIMSNFTEGDNFLIDVMSARFQLHCLLRKNPLVANLFTSTSLKNALKREIIVLLVNI